MVPLAVLIAAGVLTFRGLADDRRAAFALGLVVATNASGVLGTVYGKPGFLVPMAAVLFVAGLVREPDAMPWRAGRSRSSGALVGPLLLAALFASAVIGPFVADSPAESSLAVATLLNSLVLAAAVIANGRRPEAINAGLAGFAAGGLLMATITNVQIAIGDRSSFGGFGGWTVHQFADAGFVRRAVGPFIDDPNSYAQYLTIAVLAAVGLAFAARNRQDRLMWALGAGWITVALLVTRSRGGVISLILIGAGVLIITRRARYVVSAAVAVAVLLALTPLASYSRLGTLTSSAAAGPAAAADSSVRGRTSEARAALEMFLDKPLTGVGYGAYPSEYLEHARWIGLDNRFEPRSAHSFPLEIAAEQGLIGLGLWAAVVVFVVATVRALHRRRSETALPLALALAALATSSLFLHDVYPQAIWLLIGLVVGASIWLHPAPAPLTPPRVRQFVAPQRERLLVAMVIQNYVPALGGAERQLANLAPLMVKRGIEPVVITRHCPGRPHRDEVGGIRVLRIPTRGPKPVRAAIFIVGALYHLGRLRPDVIHAFDTLSPSTIALAHRRRFGTPVAVKLLRSGPLGDLDRLARAQGGASRLHRLLAEVDTFVAISTDIDDELARRGVEPARRIFVPNGVDARRFRPPPRRPRHRRGGAVVIATGRLAPEKRLVELADRWDRVRATHGSARLVLVGDGSERPLLEGREGIELRGQVDDIAGALRRADVYVSASAAEGLSNSLLEAMAAGLPCVVTDVGGVSDVIKSDAHGVVVPPDDLDRLVHEVAALLSDPDRRLAMGAAARARVSSGWALPTTADRLVALYRRLSSPTAPTVHISHASMVVAE